MSKSTALKTAGFFLIFMSLLGMVATVFTGYAFVAALLATGITVTAIAFAASTALTGFLSVASWVIGTSTVAEVNTRRIITASTARHSDARAAILANPSASADVIARLR